MEDEWTAGRWEEPLSLCHWLLKVVSAPGYALAENDKLAIQDIRHEFASSDDFKDLRRLVDGQDVPEAADGSPSHSSRIRALMIRILCIADFVCTTPYASQYDGFRLVAENADAIVLDEAGGMHMADALMVWGTQCRPCAMAGDMRQLPPAVMERDRNRFRNQAAVSVLEHFQKTRNPTFVLNRQMRIVEGLFDLARQIIYPDVPGITYGEMARLSNHPVARRIDAWAGARYGYRPHPDKILPVFLHCKDTICEKSGTSRTNVLQNAAAISFLDALVGSGAVKASDIAVITPYRANRRKLEAVLASHPVLADVAVSSIDAFHGREALVVVLVMCVAECSGPLFVANINRICVSVTRQVDALFIIGDIDTTDMAQLDGKQNKNLDKVQYVDAEDGLEVPVKVKAFGLLLRFFVENNRVVHFPMGHVTHPAEAKPEQMDSAEDDRTGWQETDEMDPVGVIWVDW
ncbi:hypothetical protein SPI_00749 [Niveomyces insectorum RCEF 264]|uniref:DNA2/NAM7 helicase-like C-terminal domain-containing protein n=1 Tax=Niveomyces insectorum RCEF 264 TaxID=1081102 RepID=A0A162LCA7_9HYPO|nr:hypothetical protein SPI_00749 [Niveomyces insectorum RCEF 264]